MSRRRTSVPWPVVACLLAALTACGCQQLVRTTDQEVLSAIRARQQDAIAAPPDFSLNREDFPAPGATRASRSSLATPMTEPLPEAFIAAQGEQSASAPTSAPRMSTEDAPKRFRQEPLTLTDALAYAQVQRRALQTAKEDLYLAALALTLERHLWTPQFAASLRTVYGNFGEVSGFDQAMRFVSDLSVAQRLPYGGQFTAGVINTLIRDVRQSITASETGVASLGLQVPLLRGAGHVAREQLIQLERSLTYAVRDFERFRRQQLVDVATSYFNLLRLKQAVLDAESSVQRARGDFDRARAIEETDPRGQGASLPLDTRRAEQRMLSEESRAEQLRENFRFNTDQFKLLIGMPVDEQIGIDDLEDIEAIEQKINTGEYPLLRTPPAATQESEALQTALRFRLDLLNVTDQLEDAKRGVDIAANALLPNLDWNSTVDFDTDPNRFNVAKFDFARATWRSEVVLAMNDRFAERNQYRSALIDVRQAERDVTQRSEEVRVDVRRAINQIRLQENVIDIQRRNVDVAEFRRGFARQQFEDGQIGNRDLVEAEDEWIDARNALNQAKTDGWSALLDFRLATDTLRVDEQGEQSPDPGS